MKISWNWLSELVDLSSIGTPEKLGDLLTFRGLEVEEIHRQAKGFENVISVKILTKAQHPQADRLSLCGVDRGDGSSLEIVCGAQNMKAGDIVCLAQIGANLPNGLKITQSKIRGVVSNGMLCSEDELGLLEAGKESDGILILPPTTKLGEPVAKILGLDDTLLTLKITANRGDCLSHFGIAREVAAALGVSVREPKYTKLPFNGGESKYPVKVELGANEDAPQFYGVTIEGVKVGPSPAWLVKRLEAVGSRSINNVVDATNLVMLEFGHPQHAYDAEKIAGKKIGVRHARAGEVLPLLDDTKVELKGGELVIVDGERAIGLAGVMGGGNSEVQDATTSVFLECAEFSPVLVRQASTRHQKKTDAAHRFERGIDPQGLERAISRMASLIVELAGGRVTYSTVARHASVKTGTEGLKRIRVAGDFFTRLLGMDLDNARIESELKKLQCQPLRVGEDWIVTAPSFRRDLNIPEDLAEEIARAIGYDAIPATIPKLTSTPNFAQSSRAQYFQAEKAKDSLVRLGFAETIQFSFNSKALLEKFGMAGTVKVQNPLSEEYEILVPSLLPGLVTQCLENWNRHFGSEILPVRLFELRPVFQKGEGETGVTESWKLAFLLSGSRYAQSLKVETDAVDFFDVKAVVEGLLADLGTKGARLTAMTTESELFHAGQSAELRIGKGTAGYFGRLHPKFEQQMKLRHPVWVAEFDWKTLADLSLKGDENRTFKPWGEFPSIERDFALVVRSDVTGEKITQIATKQGQPLAKSVKIFDIYRGAQVAEGMTSVAVRIIFGDDSRSLQEAEAEAASQKILQAWKKELGAELR